MGDDKLRLAGWLGMATLGCVLVVGLKYAIDTGQNEQANVAHLRSTMEAVAQRVEGRVINLPEDGKAWYLSLFVHTDWKDRANEREMVAWFYSEPRLQSLRTQTHYALYSQSSPMYQSRWRSHIPADKFPAIQLQSQDGKIVYKVSGDNMPTHADQVADDVSQLIQKGWPCPHPQPEPDVTPDPTPDTIPDAIPDITPIQTETSNDFPWALLVISIVAACGVVLIIHFKKPGGLA